jgi:subtilase family serine protease
MFRELGLATSLSGLRLLAAGAAVALAAALPAAAEPARAMVTRPVDETEFVTLHGNTLPAVAAAADLGRVDDAMPLEHMMLSLQRPPEREEAFSAYIESLTDRASPNYHKWLTAEQIGTLYGPAPQDIAAVAGWLAAHGFQVEHTYASGMTIDFSGTAGQVRGAFRTELHHVLIDGVSHIANMSDPQVPAALAPVIGGVGSLHDLRPRPASHRRPAFTSLGCDVGGGNVADNNCYLVTPADLATIYNFNPVFAGGNTGAGQTITVVEDSDPYTVQGTFSDWTMFRADFGLSGFTDGSVTITHPARAIRNNCRDPGVNANGDDFEAALDAEYASAAAPSAAIVVATCRNTATWGVMIAIENLLDSTTPPPILSISYIWCETQLGAANNMLINNAYQQAAAMGVSIFVSAGDSGGASCDFGNTALYGLNVNALASTQYNVAMGGTDFADTFQGTIATYWNTSNTNSAPYQSVLSYVPEIPWNDSCAGTLLVQFLTVSGVPYGKTGFCNTSGAAPYITTLAASGGPSSCATGHAHGSRTGGTCKGYAKPSWQQGIAGNPDDTVRDLPDLALFSAGIIWGHAYVVCYSNPREDFDSPCTSFPDSFVFGYGTSFAAPIMAGVQALINNAAGEKQGNPNPTLYGLASAQFATSIDCNASDGNTVSSKCIFHDVTQGDIDVPCASTGANCYRPSGRRGVLSTSTKAYQPAYPAGTGWDFASGLGSINVANLLAAWP